MKNVRKVYIGSLCTEIVVYGDENGFPILFFHGFGSSANCLVPDFKLLKELGLYIIAIQRPGTGASDFFKPQSVFDYTAIIEKLLDQLNIEKAHLMGWSAGGLFAQAFCVSYPNRVISLSLISSAIPFFNPSSRRLLPLKWKLISFFNGVFPAISKQMFAVMAKQLLKHPLKTIDKAKKELPQADQAVLMKTNNHEAFVLAVTESFRNKGLGPYFDTLALCTNQTVSLRNISKPTFIWHGTEDKSWPIQFAKYLYEEIPNAELQITENEGHLLILSKWNEIMLTAANTSLVR